MNSLDDSSLEEVKEAIRSEPWLAEHFDIGEKYVKTGCGRVHFTFAGLDRNINSVRSRARILLNWTDEAEPVSERAWMTLIPTLREEDSELWVTWNPASNRSATHRRFREASDPRYKLVELNWRDNPAFPAILERQRLRDKEQRPDQYPHIWEGEFATALEGAYYAEALSQARREGRIGRIGADPLLATRAYCDLGGAGARADAFALWICQFIGREIRVLDYYEAQGQPLAEHLGWLRGEGYGPGKLEVFLPHDGLNQSGPNPGSFESGFRQAGYSVATLRNEGSGAPGARTARIEAVRRRLAQCWFDEDKTQPGRDALAAYHEKRDEVRGIGLGPEHDWSSHGADAFGLMCVDYSEPGPVRERTSRRRAGGRQGWMK